MLELLIEIKNSKHFKKLLLHGKHRIINKMLDIVPKKREIALAEEILNIPDLLMSKEKSTVIRISDILGEERIQEKINELYKKSPPLNNKKWNKVQINATLA